MFLLLYLQKVNKQSKHKSKKKGAQKTNIRQSPYYVQDGDLIGVKVNFEIAICARLAELLS